jgi:YD repeat-containing protein
MKPLVSVTIALALAGLPAAALAQVTQTYSYDPNGRLTGVTTTGSAGTNTAAYAYDDADNRTSRSQTGTAAYATLARPPGPWQSLTIDTVTLTLEGSEYVGGGGSVEMGQHNCTGSGQSLSRWTPTNSYPGSHGSEASLAWPSLTLALVDAEPVLEGEWAARSDGFIFWSAMLNSERCS